MSINNNAWKIVVAMAGLLVAGCSPAKPSVGYLSGRVTNQGKVVTGGRIYFDDAELGAGTIADLNAEGRFTVATADGPGLPPGKYQVAIKPQGKSVEVPSSGELPVEILAGEGGTREPPPQNELIPAKFHSFETSGLSVEIGAGDNPDWEIDLGK